MVGCGAGSYSVGGGAMVGSRRNQVRRGWNCGANGGWWGDEGRPKAKPGRAPASTAQVADLASTSVAVLWIGLTKVSGVEKGTEASMLCLRRWKSTKSSPVKGLGRMTGMGKEEGGTSPPKPMPGIEGSHGVKPQGRMR